MTGMVDLHIHTDASDGSDSPWELLEKGKGLAFFAVTDHDTVDAALAMEALVPPGTGYVRGIEFSCISPEGECHILGYGYDPEDPVFREALEEGRQLRLANLARRLRYLETEHGIILEEEDIAWLYSLNSPGKPHLGQILAERGYAPNKEDAIQTYINPCKSERERIDAVTAVRAIIHAGGIPVWAHPLGGEGETRLTWQQFADQLRELMEYGIRGLECFYSRYGLKDIKTLREQAQANGLLISGGSDYHGTRKKGIQLGKLNNTNIPVDPEELTILKALR